MIDLIGMQDSWAVAEAGPTGYWIQNKNEDRLFLPLDNATSTLQEGTVINAIVCHDQQNNIVADMRLPKSPLNEAIVLTAKDATHHGAFFNWGMTRDLYIPSKLQETPINPGMRYVVHPFVDANTGKITGATKLHRFYPETSEWFTLSQEVTLILFAKTELGYKVLIDNTVLGLLFHSDVTIKLSIGQSIKGYIHARREDGKLDVTLHAPPTKAARKDLTQSILDDLNAHGGLSTITDKSSPDEIFKHFGVSKGAYKKALGTLFKQKKILISRDSIKLN